jgi:hypothetical protein
MVHPLPKLSQRRFLDNPKRWHFPNRKWRNQTIAKGPTPKRQRVEPVKQYRSRIKRTAPRALVGRGRPAFSRTLHSNQKCAHNQVEINNQPFFSSLHNHKV